MAKLTCKERTLCNAVLAVTKRRLVFKNDNLIAKRNDWKIYWSVAVICTGDLHLNHSEDTYSLKFHECRQNHRIYRSLPTDYDRSYRHDSSRGLRVSDRILDPCSEDN